MAFTRRQLLAAMAATSTLVPLGARAVGASNKPKYLIVFIARGGWDTTYCFEPRTPTEFIDTPHLLVDPDNEEDVEAEQTFGDIPVLTNAFQRPEVANFFANWQHRTAVVNGVWMRSIAHHTCLLRLLTGTGSWHNPDFPTIIGHALGGDLPLGSIDFTGMSNRGTLGASAGRVGLRSQLKALVDPNEVFPAPAWTGRELPLFAPSASETDHVRNYLAQRLERYGQQVSDGAWNDNNLSDMSEAIRRADMLKSISPEVLADLPLGEPADAQTQLEIGVDLLKGGVCRTVTIDHQKAWDSHHDVTEQNAQYNSYFYSLSALCERLEEEGMLEQTLVVACSEMGRSPKRNQGGGKEHWAHTSMMFIGGGVQGGRTFGGTNASLESENVDLLTGELWDGGVPLAYDSLAAGLLQALDVDPEPYFPGIPPYIGPLPS